ncbi:type III-B CRISPR module-associated Cmr3 family protein [Microbacterium sp.]|uniref:type III-B CRISPR module-associated Cmr3 family protein n=1 Tax=Microbacterium sp. TaxID=51671 RepID=UPI0039E44B2C
MTWFSITPHDTFLVRDGRTFVTGEGAVFDSVMPQPSTMGGILGSAIGGRFGWMRGPFAAWRYANGRRITYLPMPRDVVRAGGNLVTRVRPVHQPGQTTSGLVGEWLTDVDARRRGVDGWEHVPELASIELIASYLHDPDWAHVPRGPQRATLEELFPEERRIGIARDDDGTVKQGYLYQTTHRRPRDGVFMIEADLGRERLEPTQVPIGSARRRAEVQVPIGSAGRRVAVAAVSDPPELPGPLDHYPKGRVLLYLATPAIWSGGAHPPLPDGAELVGSVLGPVETVAMGANHQNGIDQTSLRWAVPAGSVFFVQFPDADTAGAWVHDLTNPQDEGRPALTLTSGDIASTGFGVVLTGTWRYAE